MIVFEFIPEDKQYYKGARLEIKGSDDWDIGEIVDAFKTFLYAMTFPTSIVENVMVKEEE